MDAVLHLGETRSMQFNHASRKKNIALSVLVNLICKGVLLVIGFWYRAAFLRILSIEYQGISGLFSSILGILSLADMGIAASIIYRIYCATYGQQSIK